MDLYEKKFAEMQKYIPFLEAMIERLKKVKDKSREPQLQKMQSLHGILTKSNGKNRLTIEKLDRCEELLLKLHNRVDKGTTSGSNIQNSRIIEDTKPNIANLKTEACNSVDNDDNYEMNRRKKTKEETPASPSPPASPDQTSEVQINIKPIIIPTERSDAIDDVPDRPASPDACELVASVGLREPKIIPTEQMNPLRKTDPDTKRIVHKWNLSSNQKSNLWESDNKAGLFSTLGGSGSSRSPGESRPRVLRHIPTVPTPSKGASLIRKPILVLEKKNSQTSGSETESPTSKWDSPMSNISESDSHNQKTLQSSPKNKELPPLPKLPATRLLVSPPPVLTMPPLTTEDLAELLSDDSDSRTGKNSDTSGKTSLKKSHIFERSADDVRNDPRHGNVQEDIESDKRWEEEYKQIVKPRRVFTSPSSTSIKHPEIMKFPPAPQTPPQIERPTDPRKRPPSPIEKNRDPPISDSRYPDNYDKHQRQTSRDIHPHNSIPDHSQLNTGFPRIPDGDPNISMQNDDINSSHYPRRAYGPPIHDQQSSDPRRDSEYYNRMRLQQEREIQQNNRPLHHSPGRSNDPCNQSQWGQNANYPPVAQGQNMPYPQQQQQQQQQQRPDMWTMKPGGNNVPIDAHMMGDPSYMRQGQYPQGPNNCRGPIIPPQDMNGPHGPCMDPAFRDDMNNQSMIPQHIPQMGGPSHPPGMQQMMQPQGYPVQGQYRGFQGENRPNIQQFDRPQDFPHPRQSWEQPVNRNSDNMPYPRQSGPGQWNRGGNRGGPPSGGPGSSGNSAGPSGGNNRDRGYNERNRGPDISRTSGFNRDPRTRGEPPPAQHSPNSQNNPRRDHLPANNPPTQSNNSSAATSSNRRDPRIAKDSTIPAVKSKEHTSTNDRGGKRNSESKGKHITSKEVRKSNEKTRHHNVKNDKKGRRDNDNESKSAEKSSKDVMQSPLESLYGVIDTAAKTGKGYGLQKFKIPKIKRAEPAPSPPRAQDDVVEENWDTPDEIGNQFDDTSANDKPEEIVKSDAHISSKEADDKKAEVTSTTGESLEETRLAKETIASLKEEFLQTVTSAQSTDESEAVDTSTKSGDLKSKETEPRWDKAFEARIIEKINELITSKEIKQQFKKLIVQSDTSEGSEQNNEEQETKKGSKKKKRLSVRRRVSSDSSEEECLAERLGKVDNTENDKSEAADNRSDDLPNEEIDQSTTKTNNDETLEDNNSPDTKEATNKKAKPFRRKKAKGKQTALQRELEKLVEDARSLHGQSKVEDKVAKEPAKIKPKRRNSLEMLQEDVREMFISNEVVTATGFRSCRLQKEDQSQMNSSIENLANSSSKKKGSSTSLDGFGGKAETDAEEVVVEPTNTRGRASRAKTRRRAKGKGKQRQSAISQEIISSDSETEDSSRLDQTNHNENNPTDASKNSDESMKSDAAGDPSKSKEDCEDAHFLRRSERVGLRESMKEPRIHLIKTDSGKIDSSKIMFDSSSDESFGIDVSELTAAVDISLHPEPQNSSSPVAKNSAKSVAPKKRRQAKKRGNAAKAREEKIDHIASADEVDSIASDLSRASSLTRGKKNVASAGKLDTNEELLSDILGNLVDPTTENDGATTPTADTKINTRKKKKKKPSWSMGILRRKKKKLQSPIPTATAENETEDYVQPETKLESSFEIPESKVDPTEFLENSITGSMEKEPKEEIFSDSSVSKNAENSVADDKSSIVHKEEPCSPVKENLSASAENDNIDDKKSLEDLVSETKTEMETNNESGLNISVRKLMSYVWSPKKDRFKCMLCTWSGKNIVHHYTLGHPGKEMMISRLTIPESKRAIGRAMVENYDDTRNANSTGKETRKFTCRFCAYSTEGSSASAMEAFYEHCTTHTGEYRFRCNCCPYQTVARSSMKTHYYRKACRNKYHGNMSLAICEDPVPNENFIYGYVCTKCNFVQLKESNVHKHIKNIHGKIQKVDIVKIDMSSFVDKDLYSSSASVDVEADTESVDLDVEEDPLGDLGNNRSTTTTTTGALNVSGTLDTDQMDIVDEALKNETDSAKSESEATSSQETPNEGIPVTGNLSAFVCPPELENKEAEIQHERRKKMQEVVENIGILNKANEKRDLSIIDKLKDKMTTDIDASLQAAEAKDEKDAAQASANSTAAGVPVLLPESVTSLAATEANSKESKSPDDHRDKSPESSQLPVKSEPADSADQAMEVAHDEAETDTEDTTEKKPKDPLADLEEERQKDESTDGEDSDRDIPAEQSRNYESDSSEQSDAEITADVNSLLEETFNITNAPMMTTIQRLAAKLQEEKSLPVGETGENADGNAEKTSNDEEIAEKVIPKPPNAIPISSLQRFFGRRNAMLQEVAKEVGQTIDQEPTPPTPSSPPKKFIRLRRLSGDKLSVPGPSPEPPVENPAKISRPPSVNDNPRENVSEIVDNALDPEDDEECSFLRIENVVSLAPGIDNNETMVNDIRKAVASSPKNSAGVSLLKKSSPNILKRPIVVRPGQLPVTPGQSSSPQLPKSNVKLIKVIKGHTVLKQKDSTHRVFGVQLKNSDVFAEMTKPDNLRRFYKCMARTCSFTTDSLQAFEDHYRLHKETVDRTKMLLTSYDFQRCAYCTETLTTWKAMSEHLKDKHIYCQYQCSYCFYRALAQSYVELHQMSVHQASPTAVLLGLQENPPIEVIDRREFVIPFVCQHECGKSFYVPGAFLAHLRTKHGNSLSIFKCHLCPAPLFKAEQLVGHYKLHGIYKYQCLYCIFGSEQSSDVHAHLSASHYNRPPHILERTLQPRPVRDKDVIHQLVVLNVDEGYKCTELTLVPGQKVADIPKNKHWLQVDRNTNDGSAVGVVTLPIGNIGMNRLFPYEKLDSVDAGKSLEASSNVSNPATPIITKFRKILAKKSPENMLIVDDSGSIRKVAKIKDPLAIDNPTNSTSEDPLGKSDEPRTIDNLSQNLNCNEEFVNIDSLADSRVNKAGEVKIGEVSVASEAKSASQGDNKDKNDDSDIEILEDIQVSPNKTAKTATKKIVEAPKEQNESSKEETNTATKAQEADPVIVCSSNENSLDNNINNGNSAAEKSEETFERPLTLDDIRNTGFTGRNLYKCGYDSCEFGAENAALLRVHIKECIFATEAKNLNCIHCNKRFVKIGFLLEHFKLHGLKRFGCCLCKDRWTQPYQAMTHMKIKHRETYSKLVPADPKNPSADGLFVVEPLPSGSDRSRGKKRGRAKSTEGEKIIEVQKLSYGPEEIGDLPRQPIYQQEIHCAVCSYKNKVRTNIIRHLQLHSKAESVPESGPVNPVPCLDKNERMFDKMVNLASSSHQNGRMGGSKPKETIPDSGAEFLPKFIPENKRYVCGVTECNYLSIDEGMLRTHLKALHPEEPYFRCPHCPAQVPGHEAQNIPIDKMGIHLKMHDTRLYKCSHCNHHHYHRHVVERHLADKHGEANPFVKVIREIENTENTQQQTPQPAEETSADPDGNHWKCNICDFKCIYKADMQSHANVNHDEKAQFKCTACSYKTNNKITFDQHILTKHATDPNADYTMTFEKIKGAAPRKTAESGEGGALDEPFDTTPLWRRDMPRIRHIRGILFEDDEQSPVKSGKRKSDAEPAGKSAKIKPSKSQNDSSSTDRDNDSWVGSLFSESSLNTDELGPDSDNFSVATEKINTSRLVRKFGPYGSPIAHFWRCTICQCFKTKYRHDMRDHLYRDLKYFRYRCTLCGYTGVSKNSALKHFMRMHENRRPTADEQETLPPDEDLETWVKTLLKSQTAQMRGMMVDADGNIISEPKPKKANILIARKITVAEAPSKPNTATTTQTLLRDAKRSNQTVGLDQTSSIGDMKTKTTTESGMTQIEDEDSNDALVIDSKDDGLEEEAPDNAKVVGNYELMDADRLLVCKHCNMKFETMKGFKLHVQIRHLRRLNYLCPYCDTSSNSEKLMRKHLRLKHANLPEQVDLNPASTLPDLTNEFWEKEYGVPMPEKARKRRRPNEETKESPMDKTSNATYICGTCGFRAINSFGLGVHMRTHTSVKNYKCAYCTFAASDKFELWQHSEQNHGNLDWRVGNAVALPDSADTLKTESTSVDRAVEDYAEYVAAEASATSGPADDDTKSEIILACFYCNTTRKTLESLKEHWKNVHKNTTKLPCNANGLPFRYKEIEAAKNCEKMLRCGYCPKRGLPAEIRDHSKDKHPLKALKFVEIPVTPDTWVCQWCGESVDSEAKKKVHQNMFHSHLPPSFERPPNSGENSRTSREAEPSNCPKCPFKTSSVAAMQKHVVKHVDSVRCKRCDKTFPDVSIAILHNTQAHPGEVSAIEGFTANVEKLMAKINWRTVDNASRNSAETVPRSAMENWRRNCGVAKKSTTKSTLGIQPKPSDFRAVARKSTNPLPRYPPGTRFSTDNLDTDNIVNAVSYYGVPRVPVNLNKISTYMTIGGKEMKLNCTHLAQLFNIEPRVVLDDLKNSSLLPDKN